MENQFAHIHLDMWHTPEQRSEQLVESKKEEGKGHTERRIKIKIAKKGNFNTKPQTQPPKKNLIPKPLTQTLQTYPWTPNLIPNPLSPIP